MKVEQILSNKSSVLLQPSTDIEFDAERDPFIKLQTYDPWLLPSETNSLISILVRVQNSAESRLDDGRFGNGVAREFSSFVRDIAKGFNGNLKERSQYLDDESYGESKKREEMVRLRIMDIDSEIEKIIKNLRRDIKSFFLIIKNLEDFPTRLKQTLDAVILLKCNHLRFIVLGDRDIYEMILNDMFIGERRKLRNNIDLPNDNYNRLRVLSYLDKVFE